MSNPNELQELLSQARMDSDRWQASADSASAVISLARAIALRTDEATLRIEMVDGEAQCFVTAFNGECEGRFMFDSPVRELIDMLASTFSRPHLHPTILLANLEQQIHSNQEREPYDGGR